MQCGCGGGESVPGKVVLGLLDGKVDAVVENGLSVAAEKREAGRVRQRGGGVWA